MHRVFVPYSLGIGGDLLPWGWGVSVPWHFGPTTWTGKWLWYESSTQVKDAGVALGV